MAIVSDLCNLFRLAFSVVGFVCFSTSGNSQSSVPPIPQSDPRAAFSVGILDVARKSPLAAGNLLPCFGTKVSIYLNRPAENKAWLNFKLARPNSRVIIKMVETPDASLWFELYDKDLGNRREFRGGDDQVLDVSDLGPGEYYVEVASGSGVKQNPDGSQRGVITLRAEPEGYRRSIETSPVDLGTLSANRSISHRGSVVIRQERNTGFDPTPEQRECPLEANSPAKFLNEYFLQAEAGTISVTHWIPGQDNWPSQYPFNLYYWDKGPGSWRLIQDSQVVHSGGELRIQAGYSGNTITQLQDAYVDYQFFIARSGAAPVPTNNPDGSWTIPLNSPSTSNAPKITLPPGR